MDVHAQFQNIIKSMNRDIGVTVMTSNALFQQVRFRKCGEKFTSKIAFLR